MNWEYTDTAFDQWWPKGFIRANGARPEPQQYIIQHLPNKARKEIAAGAVVVDGQRADGSVIAKYAAASSKTVTTQWEFTSHSAEHGGTGILKAIIPGRRFPFPKSLFAVEDALRLVLCRPWLLKYMGATARHAIYGGQWRRSDRNRPGRKGP